MSKMSQLNLIAQGVSDHIKEIIEDSVDWQMSEVPLNGDAYNEAKVYVTRVALQMLLQNHYKQIDYDSWII